MAERDTDGRGAAGGRARRVPRQRWECRCGDPPILLARYDPGGKIEIKLRDRYYIASGCVYATCPRCGAHHILDLRPADPDGSPPPIPATDPADGWR
jgi:hypothetical protein